MSIESKLSRHWTDEQVVAHLYGVGPEDAHLSTCAQCRERVSAMQTRRGSIEDHAGTGEVSPEFLARQRRRIYAKLEEPVRWWLLGSFRRWAPVAAMLCVMGAGFIAIEQTHPFGHDQSSVSDAQLAADVSRLADDPEPSPTAPLQALFEE